MRGQGFTLIELLMTLVVVGLLATMAVPSMGQYITRERLRGVLGNLKQELAFARSESIKRHKTVYIVTSGTRDWCIGLSLRDNCDCSLADANASSACTLPVNGTQIVRRLSHGDYPGVTLERGLNFGFDGVRGVASSSGRFMVSVPDYSGAVVVSTLGRIRTCGALAGLEVC